jgi:hypothetical protein
MDKLLTTSAVGEILGGKNRKDVIHLIRTGRLKAKEACVRGKGKLPHYLVLESEVKKYIQSLPDVVPDVPPPPRPCVEAAMKHKRRPRRGNLAGLVPGLIEFV